MVKDISKNKKIILEIIISIIGVWSVLYGIKMLQANVLINMQTIPRLVLFIVTYWTIAVVPAVLVIKNKEKLTEFGFEKENINKQILIGIGIALGLCIALTILPVIFMGKDIVDPGKNYIYIWQFIWDLLYNIIAIGVVEEFIFRGFFLGKFEKLTNSKVWAIIISSVLFGLFHIFNGNIIQLLVTPIIGAVFAISMEKIKKCSLLSVIIAHGIYNWLIVVLVAII